MSKSKNVGVSRRFDLPDELIDRLLVGYERPSDISGHGGLLAQLTKRVLERAMNIELDDHLGYEKGQAPPLGVGNSRNGTTAKTLVTQHGQIRIDQPRDRDSSFQPQIVPKHQRRFDGFDDKIIAMYSRGMTVRDIRAHLAEIYNTDVSPDLISQVTDAVLEEVKEWQNRPLDPVYPIVYIDGIVIKTRQSGVVFNSCCYLAVGVNLEGEREVLGIWHSENESSKFWMGILAELKKRGVNDILTCCCDGLKGLPDAIEAVYDQTWIQTCIVHQIRNSLRFVPDKHKRAVARDLKPIYTAINSDQARDELEKFDEKWGDQYPMITQSWKDNWERIIPFLAFPQPVRRVIYTTNTIENLNRQIRKNIKNRGHFPTQQSATKLIYLTIKNTQQNKRTNNWTQALTAFKIHFQNRIP